MKKVFVIVAIAAALASVAGVAKGWKWNHVKSGTAVTHVADNNMPDGWTWDGADL